MCFKLYEKEAVTMARAKITSSSNQTKKIRPALTPEAEENQMISLAFDLVKKRLVEGTASSQETTHFLKLASTKYKLEMAKLEEENKLMKARTEAIQSQKKIEELYSTALAAMRSYSGQGDDNENY